MASGGRHEGWGGGNGRFSNPSGLDPAHRLELNEARAQLARLERDAQASVSSDEENNTQFWPDVGKYVIPPQNTWAAHEALVEDPKQELGFNPAKYPYFDGIIAEKFGNRALFDPAHPDYAKYQSLRTNLAVLRNDTMGFYMDDGPFDPGDEKFVPKLAGIAEALGDALANDKWYKRPFSRAIDIDVAGAEGVGAAEMYQYLLELQEKPGMFQTLGHNISTLLGFPDRDWRLPGIEHTPFSANNLEAPLPISLLAQDTGTQAAGKSFVDRYLSERKEPAQPNHGI